jgi:hypothetical protein
MTTQIAFKTTALQYIKAQNLHPLGFWTHELPVLETDAMTTMPLSFKVSESLSTRWGRSGLPNGLFANQKSRFGKNLEDLGMETNGIVYFILFRISCGNLVHFWSFGIFCDNVIRKYLATLAPLHLRPVNQSNILVSSTVSVSSLDDDLISLSRFLATKLRRIERLCRFSTYIHTYM